MTIPRLSLSSTGKVVYTLKTPYRDGTTQVAFEGAAIRTVDFIARLAALARARSDQNRVSTSSTTTAFWPARPGPNHRWRGLVTPASIEFWLIFARRDRKPLPGPSFYGPNSNIVVGSSIVFFVECQLRYVMGCLKLQLEKCFHTVECRKEAMDSYNLKIDALNRQRAWGAPAVSSWHKNRNGRVTQNWPGMHGEWWEETLAPDPSDFLLN